MSRSNFCAGDLVNLADRRIVAEHRREKEEMARRMRAAAERSRDNPPLPLGEPPQMFVDMLFDFMKTAIEAELWTPDRGGQSIDEFCQATARQVSWQWPVAP